MARKTVVCQQRKDPGREERRVGVAASDEAVDLLSKVLVSHSFAGPEKSTKVMLQNSGQQDPSTKKPLFHVWVRICDVHADNTEVQCKDTRVLDNVVPGSVN